MHTWIRSGDHFVELTRDRMTRWLFLFGLVLTLGQWVTLMTAVPRSESFLPLHYTIYFGIDLTGSWIQLAWLPGASSVTWLLHVVGATRQVDVIWQRAWAWLASLIIGLFSLAMLMLVLNVFPNR
jgi:hypothetical protein